MSFGECVFWSTLALIAYTYAVYPLLLLASYACVQTCRDLRYLARRQDRRVARRLEAGLPPVSLVIPAFNEEEHLLEKLRNLDAIDYAKEKLEVVFVSDASTDKTNEILSQRLPSFARVVCLEQHVGKATALNLGVREASHDLLILSDASTLLEPDAVQLLVRHFRDKRVGVVCGSLHFRSSATSQETEGIYWKYESMLRLMEARLGATLTASGALYAIRRECYPILPPATIIDDFVIPMHARTLGFQVEYDPEVWATDFAAESVAGEFRRRVRIATGSFRALPLLLRSRMRGFTLLAFLSHKLLRWLLPFLQLILLFSTAFIANHTIFAVAVLSQGLLICWSALGAVLQGASPIWRPLRFAFYLSAINVAFLVGFMKAVHTSRNRQVSW